MYCKGESGDFPGILLFKTGEQDLASVYLDTSFGPGARFVFAVPV